MSEHQTNIVAVGLIAREGKIFIAKRSKTKVNFPGQFELVGGHLDDGETLEQGLKREIFEEIKVAVDVGEVVGAFTFTDTEGLKVEVGYLCSLVEAGAEPLLNPEDHSEGHWISEDEIDKFQKEDEETEMLRKAFQIIGGKNG